MKKLLLLLFISTASFSQESNFTISEGALSWKHVFKADLSQEEIKSQLLADPFLNPIASNFTGESNPIKLKCNAPTAIYFNAQLVYFARIQFKEGRYLVEVSNFQLIPNQVINFDGVESTANPESLDAYVIKNNSPELRQGNLHKNALECLDKFLLDKFTFQDKKMASDW